jgi:hypothetical protein
MKPLLTFSLIAMFGVASLSATPALADDDDDWRWKRGHPHGWHKHKHKHRHWRGDDYYYRHDRTHWNFNFYGAPPVVVERPVIVRQPPIVDYHYRPIGDERVIIQDNRNNYGSYCREYQTNVYVGGRMQQGFGTACMMPDGSWAYQQ